MAGERLETTPSVTYRATTWKDVRVKCLVIENAMHVTRDNVYLFCPQPQPGNPIDPLLYK